MSDKNNNQVAVKVGKITLNSIKLECSNEDFKGDVSFWVDGILVSKFLNYNFENLEIPLPQDIIDGEAHEIFLETSAGFSTSFSISFDSALAEIRKKAYVYSNDSSVKRNNSDLKDIYNLTRFLNKKLSNILNIRENDIIQYDKIDSDFDSVINESTILRMEDAAINSESINYLNVEFDKNTLLILEKEFDNIFYSNQLNESVDDTHHNLLRHYLVHGEKLGLLPNSWFIPQLYFEANKDVYEAGLGAFYHYVITGRQEGRHIHQPLIDDASYKIVRPFFDANFYRTTYQIDGTDEELFNHFLSDGWKNLWDPNRYFSVAKYLELNPDIRDAKVNPLIHYITIGRAEGRVSNIELGFRYKIIESMLDLDERKTYVLTDDENPTVDLSVACENLLSNHKSKAFSISHDNFVVNVGGLQLCVRREASALINKDYDHIHLYPSKAMLRLDRLTSDPLLGVIINYTDIGMFKLSTIKSLLLNKVDNKKNNLFIVHSFLGHNINSIIKFFKFLDLENGYFWVHDYAAVCAGLNLLRNDVEFCNAPSIESTSCSLCVYKSERTAQVSDHKEFFDSFNVNIASPSSTALSIWQRGGIQKYKSAVIHPHGEITYAYTRAQYQHKVLRVAFLGFAADHKGWPVFTSLINEYGQTENYKFYHFASYKADGDFEYVEVNAQKSGADMTKKLVEHEIDIVVIWSICAETFCLVAHEAAAAGVKIITRSKAGYLSDFVSNGSYGVVLDKEQDLIELFGSYDRLQQLCNSNPINIGNFELSNLTADLI